MEKEAQYFVVKVASIQDLLTCSKTSQWACKDRITPPQPVSILQEAFNTGPVILVFSVNNCHGWHGYAEMISPPPTSQPKETVVKTSGSREQISNIDWKYFDINWKIIYICDFGERCLPFSTTDTLTDLSGSPVNKTRNWQELPVETGKKLCHLLEDYHKELCLKRDEKIRKQLESVPEPFYESETQSSVELWGEIVKKVEEDLGKVILACPFGSQRYNLSIPESDTDMFIVYQAKTSQMLGFYPPKQTVKNTDRQSTDYTIHEILRYAELLASGDARCVETLFLHQSTIIQDSPDYQLLKTGRKKLLHRETLNKYLSDAQGTRGTKLLQKWCNNHEELTVLPPKMCKLLYVIIRLLQNARDIVCGEDVTIYREVGSQDREILMTIRQGDVPVKTAWAIIDRLEDEISQNSIKVPEKSPEVDTFLEDWLLKLRYADMNKDQIK